MGTYLVMKNNFKRSFQHRLVFAVTFLLPVILCVILGFVKFGKTSLRVGILEEGGSTSLLSEREELFDLLDQSEGISFAVADEANVNTDLMTGKFQMVLDYRKSEEVSEFTLISYQSKDRVDKLQSAFHEAVINRVSVHLEGLKSEGMTVTERSMALLMSLFLVFATVHASAIIRDKQSGTFLRYQYAMQNNRGYLSGYIASIFFVTYLQVLLCLAALVMLQKDFTVEFMQATILAGAIAVLATIFSLIICYNSKSEVHANITASSLAAVMSLLGGTFVAIEAMPSILRWLSFVSPIRWVEELLRVL